MKPADVLERIADANGGFTAVTSSRHYHRIGVGPSGEVQDDIATPFVRWQRCGRVHVETGAYNTLWRPCAFDAGTVARLVSFNEKSFYQMNDNVTIAFYKVPRYPYMIAAWFDNQTGRRIA